VASWTNTHAGDKGENGVGNPLHAPHCPFSTWEPLAWLLALSNLSPGLTSFSHPSPGRCCPWALTSFPNTSCRRHASTDGPSCTTVPSRLCGTGSSFCWSSTQLSSPPTQLPSCSTRSRWRRSTGTAATPVTHSTSLTSLWTSCSSWTLSSTSVPPMSTSTMRW